MSHQRFFHPLAPNRKIKNFRAENVGLFTPYQNASDFVFQAMGIVMKPFLYILAVVYNALLLLTLTIIAIALILCLPFFLKNQDFIQYSKDVLYDWTKCAIEIVVSTLNIVLEPLLTTVGLFTRFFAPMVNPKTEEECAISEQMQC